MTDSTADKPSPDNPYDGVPSGPAARSDRLDLEKRPDASAEPAPAAPAAPAPAAHGPAAMRASDADRDRVAELLREAMAEGRLTAEEHGERIDAVYSARTMGELEPLTRDLPVPGRAAQPAPARAGAREPEGLPQPKTVSAVNVAVFSGVARKGRWRVPGRSRTVAVFGGVDLDFTEAVFEHREVVIEASVLFGGVDIKVPENVTLRGSGFGLFGGFDVRENVSDEPDAPVVTVRGFAVFGGLSARRKKGRRLADWNRKRLAG